MHAFPRHPAGLLALLFALAACGIPGTASAPTEPATSIPGATFEPVATAAPAPEIIRTKGDPNAPVKLIEYSDFQCPYCASFARETMGKIDEAYIQTGKVYFEFRDFPLEDIHHSAVLAAHVANCSAVQDGFFAMHDRLFTGQEAGEWGSDLAADFSTFLGYARELKLDDKALQACVQSQQFTPQIQQDYRAGLEAGVRSTPSFVINGELIAGAQPFAVWQQAIDTALAQQPAQ